MAIRTLVSTDGSEPSRKTANVAVRLAGALPLEVTLTHVLDFRGLEYKMIPDFQVEMIREGAKRAAEDLLEKEAQVFREGKVSVSPKLLVGAPGPAICEYAKREKVSLIVTGRRGHGDLQDLMFGSVSNHVVHHSDVPVLVVKKDGPLPLPGDHSRPVRALLAVDGSPATERCLDYLCTLGEAAKGLHFTLIHVVNPDKFGLEHLSSDSRYETLTGLHQKGEALVGAGAERLRAVGFSCDTRVEEGVAGKILCRVYEEDEYEILVMGRRGLGELQDLLFGTVCHHVVHHCRGHVLLVP